MIPMYEITTGDIQALWTNQNDRGSSLGSTPGFDITPSGAGSSEIQYQAENNKTSTVQFAGLPIPSNIADSEHDLESSDASQSRESDLSLEKIRKSTTKQQTMLKNILVIKNVFFVLF